MEVNKWCGASECKNELGCLIAEELRQYGVVRIPTSRGEIVVRDTHVFEITAPQSEQLYLMFHGDSTVFRVGGWLAAAKQFGHNGKLLDKPPHLM